MLSESGTGDGEGAVGLSLSSSYPQQKTRMRAVGLEGCLKEPTQSAQGTWCEGTEAADGDVVGAHDPENMRGRREVEH